jgi:FHA domain-containing protein
MEKIELRVEKFAGADVDRHWVAVFGVAGGTIGRGGQNKLVLPDTDAGVARVHAMVRLESDAAYIANLCERRSIHVAGRELQSGQETQLQVGAEVQIGPYSLRAVPPGTPASAPVAPVAASASPVPAPAAPLGMTTQQLPRTVPSAGAALASAPNPWADIPEQARGEGLVAGALSAQAEPAQVPPGHGTASTGTDDGTAALNALFGGAEAAPQPDLNNPFAMLGRAEAVAAPSLGLPPASVAHAASLKQERNSPATALPGAAAQAQHPPVSPAPAPTPISGFGQVAGPFEAAAPKAGLPNVFDGLTPPVLPAAPTLNRALVIPADFDPFARDLKRETENRDPWAGGLPAQSLADVANIQGDELLRSLPLKGRFEQAMDNPAHSGLPKALEPQSELDPMRLFQGAEAAGSLATPDAAAAARGPELAQVFNLPKGMATTPAGAPGPAAQPPAATLTAVDRPTQEAASPAVQALGLQPTQGLDLSMFGGAAALAAPFSVGVGGGPNAAATAPARMDAAPASPKPQPTMPSRATAATPAAVPDARPPLAAPPAAPTRPAPPIAAPLAQAVATPSPPVQAPQVQQPPLQRAARPSVTVDLNLNDPEPAPVLRPTPTTAPAPATAPATAGIPDSQALINAFLEGAGLAPGRVPAAMTPEFMRHFGEAFRVAVQGTIDLLAARSEIKREFRADVTIIAPRANNPLKFLPNADGVIMQMVGQSFPGFMKPVPSMKEAYFDLQVHQLALMAGIRAAYAEALARFDPVELEKRCEASGGLLSKISSTARKAAVWDDYKQSYNAIRRHAEDDLVAFSGEAFVTAYEAAAEAARAHP